MVYIELQWKTYSRYQQNSGNQMIGLPLSADWLAAISYLLLVPH
jgi:hypothetical protein